jgi:exopolysaccharide biosynthesis polyprenyl glycosylphosphotransferase
MVGRKQEFNQQWQQFVDAVLLVIAVWAAHTLRYSATDWFGLEKPISGFNDFSWLLIIIPWGAILLELQGYYSHPLQKTVWRSLHQMGLAAFWLMVLLATAVLFFKLDIPSRAVILLFGAIAAVLLLLRERVTVFFLRRRVASGRFREKVLLAGLPAEMQEFRRTLMEDQLLELEVVAEIDLHTEPIAALVEALHTHAVSRVIFAGGHARLDRLQEAIGACEIEGVEAWLIADFVKTSIARPSFDVLGTRPMLVFRTTPEISWALLVKATIDRVGATVALVLASPLFVIVALAIRLTSPGPVIFRQLRGGKNGKPFVMYKFRSMRTDAEMQRAELEAFNVMSGPVFKVEADPRVTKVGAIIRKWSLDELPQLLNVLRGEMSLVGPRPLPLYEVEKFENTAQRRRLSVKPGLTCLWQVSGRNEVRDFSEWVRLDLAYIDNWSIWLDLKILLKTIPTVLTGAGAR